jgi:insertion element IS1 protein InsB
MLLAPFSIGMITSDNWGSYAREAPKDKHLTGKIFTQRMERNNLTLRTRIKHLVCLKQNRDGSKLILCFY